MQLDDDRIWGFKCTVGLIIEGRDLSLFSGNRIKVKSWIANLLQNQRTDLLFLLLVHCFNSLDAKL
jgi:hypothetical protein